MIEVVVIFAMVAFVVTYVWWTFSGATSRLAKSEKLDERTGLMLEENLSEDSVFGNQFLAQLQHEIEATLFPRPTDSVLKRHYDSLVAAKLGERLAQMPV